METENEENRNRMERRGNAENNNELEKNTKEALQLFQKRVKKGGLALNIALIGPSGCGKSSFCNSIMTAFCVEGWRERAMIGHYGGRGIQVTHHLLSFPKTKYLDSEDLMEYNYPTLVDMNGFNDSSDDLVEELLRIVFFGRLPQEEKLTDAANIYKTSGLNGLKEHYSNNFEDLKIDRIIFIASATSPPPQRLMDAVTKTARGEMRVIPIFGVLTHKDKINPDDEDYQTLEKDFKEGLGLQDNRFLLCTSYCDDYDKLHGKSRLDQRHPELDIPILRFMQQVCDPAYEIIGDWIQYRQDEHSPSPESTSTVTSTDQPPSTEYEKPKRWSLPEDKLWGIGIRGVVIAILAFGVLYILASSLDASRICAEVCSKSGNGTHCTSNVQSLCSVQSMSGLMKFVVFLLLVAAIIGIELLFDKIEQSGNARN
uniref:Uncharacterized protein LOC111104025 n=1 Tax=Crassostrea virginica TaxID=6565 RepID=A0A8B8API3_CRAVI|nr:uncharacterized protein LOC111104025 [Crassostrea virginica]